MFYPTYYHPVFYKGYIQIHRVIVIRKQVIVVVKLQVLGLRLGVDFTFALDNNDNNDNNNDNDNNPHLNSLKETVPGGKEQGLGIRDKISGIKHKG